MAKEAILREIVARLRGELQLLNRAASDAREGATDDEVKSDGKYDTRGLESSYLARGHAMKFETLAADVRLLEGFNCPLFSSSDPIGLGALVELRFAAETFFYIVLPRGGGIEVDVAGVPGEITVLTPDSPLGGKLLDRRVGERVAGVASSSGATIVSVT